MAEEESHGVSCYFGAVGLQLELELARLIRHPISRKSSKIA